jgi:4a-hydroxytetrahydrobiopterin dehydratase
MGIALGETELTKALGGLAAWKRKGAAIERLLEFGDFSDAMVFVNKVAEAAEEANHHPDFTISYNKVTLLLTSHDSGGVTQRDIRMAKTIDQIAE